MRFAPATEVCPSTDDAALHDFAQRLERFPHATDEEDEQRRMEERFEELWARASDLYVGYAQPDGATSRRRPINWVCASRRVREGAKHKTGAYKLQWQNMNAAQNDDERQRAQLKFVEKELVDKQKEYEAYRCSRTRCFEVSMLGNALHLDDRSRAGPRPRDARSGCGGALGLPVDGAARLGDRAVLQVQLDASVPRRALLLRAGLRRHWCVGRTQSLRTAVPVPDAHALLRTVARQHEHGVSDSRARARNGAAVAGQHALRSINLCSEMKPTPPNSMTRLPSSDALCQYDAKQTDAEAETRASVSSIRLLPSAAADATLGRRTKSTASNGPTVSRCSPSSVRVGTCTFIRRTTK